MDKPYPLTADCNLCYLITQHAVAFVVAGLLTCLTVVADDAVLVDRVTPGGSENAGPEDSGANAAAPTAQAGTEADAGDACECVTYRAEEPRNGIPPVARALAKGVVNVGVRPTVDRTCWVGTIQTGAQV